jgi:predicted aldo/keto reductase-like oxidoreductase
MPREKGLAPGGGLTSGWSTSMAAHDTLREPCRARVSVAKFRSEEVAKVSNHQSQSISRRDFVRRSGLVAGGMLIGSGSVASAAQEAASPASDEWPRRVLGRTNVPVTTMTLGTAPCGLCPKILPPEIAKIVNEAVDLGITSIDTAPAYKQSEEGVGLALGKRRKEVFLATKVMADTVEEAEESLAKSFKLVKTDWFDLVYYHSVGSHDVEKAMAPDGVFSWLVKQKQAGKFRFLGISGHHLPRLFPQLIETGEVDVLLTVVNFVDRHTYNFEEKVLPVARKHNLGIVAMKVFGGASRKAGSYPNPNAPPEMPLEHLETAVRYALGTPGVTTVNLGAHKREQVRKNVELVKRYQPLSAEEQSQVDDLGQKLAQEWGPHFGPVA